MYFVSFSPEINYYSLTKGRILYLASYSMLQLFSFCNYLSVDICEFPAVGLDLRKIRRGYPVSHCTGSGEVSLLGSECLSFAFRPLCAV